MPRRFNRLALMLLAVGLLAAVILSGCVTTKTGPVKLDPVPSAGPLKPGLAVIFFDEFFERHVDKIPTGKVAEQMGRPGSPIPVIDHKFERNEVFGSGRNRGVAMQMTGYIIFPAPGHYSFRANSNDGIRFYLDGKLIFEDPDVHSDRLSDPGSVKVSQAGPVPVMIQYFQRKGTATLQLFWQPPGAPDFTIIPPMAYGH